MGRILSLVSLGAFVQSLHVGAEACWPADRVSVRDMKPDSAAEIDCL